MKRALILKESFIYRSHDKNQAFLQSRKNLRFFFLLIKEVIKLAAIHPFKSFHVQRLQFVESQMKNSKGTFFLLQKKRGKKCEIELAFLFLCLSRINLFQIIGRPTNLQQLRGTKIELIYRQTYCVSKQAPFN